MMIAFTPMPVMSLVMATIKCLCLAFTRVSVECHLSNGQFVLMMQESSHFKLTQGHCDRNYAKIVGWHTHTHIHTHIVYMIWTVIGHAYVLFIDLC